jgi:hypothetical protein
VPRARRQLMRVRAGVGGVTRVGQARAVDPGDLCQPSGPSGEGQARGHAQNARGESLDHEGSNRQLGYEEVTDAAGFDCIRCACTHAAE